TSPSTSNSTDIPSSSAVDGRFIVPQLRPSRPQARRTEVDVGGVRRDAQTVLLAGLVGEHCVDLPERGCVVVVEQAHGESDR
ncbi:MAG: hypothetical protein ACRDTT_35880, partial [Pseudonocardiaceae bacterium]